MTNNSTYPCPKIYRYIYISLSLVGMDSYIRRKDTQESCTQVSVQIYRYISIQIYRYINMYVLVGMDSYIRIKDTQKSSTQVQIQIYRYISIQIYRYINIYIYQYVWIHMYVEKIPRHLLHRYLYRYICTYIYMYVCIQKIHILHRYLYIYRYIYVHIFVGMDTYVRRKDTQTSSTQVSIQIHMYIYVYIYPYRRFIFYIGIYIYTCVDTYIYIYTCIENTYMYLYAKFLYRTYTVLICTKYICIDTQKSSTQVPIQIPGKMTNTERKETFEIDL